MNDLPPGCNGMVVIEGMADVELVGDVGRRDDDGVRLALSRFGMKHSRIQPTPVDVRFDRLRVVDLVHVHDYLFVRFSA